MKAPRRAPRTRLWLPVRIGALAAAYYATARAGLALGALPGNVAPVWPPTGVAIAALFLYGRRLWPGVALGALAVNGLGGVPFLGASGMAVGNTLEAVAAAWLLRAWCRERSPLDDVRGVAGLTMGAALSTTVSATIGVASLRLAGVIATGEVATSWRVWWVGDALGALVMAPVIIAWAPVVRHGLPWRTAAAKLGSLVGYGVLVVVMFRSTDGVHYLVFPLLAVLAFRVGPRGTSAGATVTWAVAVHQTSQGHGPFASVATTEALWQLDAFLAVAVLTGLLLAAVVNERDRVAVALTRTNRDLDRRVDLRTAQLATEREALMDAQRLAHIGSWRWNRADERVVCSEEFYRILGLDPRDGELTYDGFLAAVVPEDRAAVEDAVTSVLSTGADYEIEHRIIRPDGEVRWVRAEGRVVLDPSGQSTAMFGTSQDITDRHWAELRFQELIEAAPDAIVVVAEDSTIQLVNRQTEAMFGYDRSELLGQPIETLIPVAARARHPRLRDSYFARPETRPMGAGRELLALRRNGEEFPVDIGLAPIRTDDGFMVSASIRDITDRRAAEAKVAHQATHDALTGLPNRVLLADRLSQALARAERLDTTVAVLFLDLDRLKVINDSRGHSVGDELLCAVAERLQAAVRPGDTLARFGGDEFVIVTEGIGDEYPVSALPERIGAALRLPVRIDGVDMPVGASIGVAVAAPGDQPEALIRDADAAMYRAKETGRDRYVVFDTEMRASATDRLEIENGLRRGLDNDEFEVHYQPIVELSTGAVAGVEALVRWRTPDRGLLPPSEFIPVAEETGLIVPLGTLVLQSVCRDLQRWRRDEPCLSALCASVNLSARQLVRPDLAQTVRDIVTSTGIDPSLLTLEITESVLLDDAEAALRGLRALKEIGVRIGVDDFGTGYSSLTYLKRFPVDTLKIDRSFIDDLDVHDMPRRDRAIVASVTDLAHAFGLTTVAEGIETATQLASLHALGCELGQGYLWSTPLPEPEARAWLVERIRSNPAAVRRSRSAHGPLRVLVVEDQASLRRLLQLTVDDDPGFQVVGEAGDGREAVALARRHQPDIVLLDLAMPGIGGLEALPLIQAVDRDAKIVVVSGLDPGEIADESERLGAAGYFSKHRDPELLVPYLRELVGAPSVS